MPELIEPTMRLAASFRESLEEYLLEGHEFNEQSMLGRVSRYYRDQPGRDLEGVQRYLKEVEVSAAGLRADGFPRQTTLWWADGQRYLGRIAIRHWLTDALRVIGGHIGYDVRPSARRQGHATAMLAAALPIAAGFGIDRALLTCDADNTASRKVIERSNGILEGAADGKLRYWVPTVR